MAPRGHGCGEHRIEPGVALGVQQELPEPVVVLLLLTGLPLLGVHLGHHIVALEHDGLASGAARGPHVGTLAEAPRVGLPR